MHITLGSRQSHLAKKQAYMVKAKLEALGHEVSLYLKPSMGDLNLDLDLSTTAEKGVFTQDFTNLLLEKKVDCVVHSWKDLPIVLEGSTEVVSTLKREDSRDLFLIKKESLKKNKWTILTSSPRREYHLKEFFDFLEDESPKDIEFKSIRGNIPTRFKKFIDDKEADGFCVALAAVKRLVSDEDFNKDYPQIWEQLLSQSEFCVLPESFCPSAAAQGALALEVLKENSDLIKILKEINSEDDMASVVKERELLKAYGGGCHLAIGTQVYTLSHGVLSFSSGQHKNETFKNTVFEPRYPYPSKIEESQIWFSSADAKSERSKIAVSLKDAKRSILVTRKEAVESLDKNTWQELFVSGLKTWKSLYKSGLWVNGCLDSLGAALYPKDVFKRGIKEHLWLTRAGVTAPDEFKTCHTYDVKTEVNKESFKDKEYFVWMSGELLLTSIVKHPELKNKIHFVGMGRSFEAVESEILDSKNEIGLKTGVNLFPFYTIDQLKKDITITS